MSAPPAVVDQPNTQARSCNGLQHVVLLRHPAPLLPRGGICYGRLEVGLQAGWQEAVDTLALPDLADARIWTSPAARCARPAARLAGRLGTAIRTDARLQELDFGAWEGLAWDQVPRVALDRWAADLTGFAPPAGETGGALIARVQEFHAALRHDGRDAIVLSHGGPLRVLASLLRGAPVDLCAPAPGFLAPQSFSLA
ncbi:histidine phosphatase family protein [Lichenicoccus roseus]|uniref:Phosphoglycerate mutase n=1 Tax=Lichenicoccus roseus TaxID=2683649 RepID=A0A5R9J2D7_9PROT|nr:histidine phosphatase family protein [Lichenicoccus roseus]TLU71023.1 phosphoglycerate mutase [Lichenicoccus roseus]